MKIPACCAEKLYFVGCFKRKCRANQACFTSQTSPTVKI